MSEITADDALQMVAASSDTFSAGQWCEATNALAIRVATLETALPDLLRWVEIVCRDVKDDVPANDEMLTIRASSLYTLRHVAQPARVALAEEDINPKRRTHAPQTQ